MHRWLDAGDGRHGRLHRHVIGACRAAPDAHALAAPHIAVISGAARHCQVHVGPFERACRFGMLGSEPAIERGQCALRQDVGLEDAAVEQHRRGVQEAGVRIDLAGKTFQLGGRARLASQQGRQVARHARILRVGQAELRQAAAGAAGGAGRSLDLGEEAFQDGGADFRQGELGADRAAYQFRAPAGHHDGLGFEAGIGTAGFPWRCGRHR